MKKKFNKPAYDKKLNVLISTTEWEELTTEAERIGISFSEYIRYIIRSRREDRANLRTFKDILS